MQLDIGLHYLFVKGNLSPFSPCQLRKMPQLFVLIHAFLHYVMGLVLHRGIPPAQRPCNNGGATDNRAIRVELSYVLPPLCLY